MHQLRDKEGADVRDRFGWDIRILGRYYIFLDGTTDTLTQDNVDGFAGLNSCTRG